MARVVLESPMEQVDNGSVVLCVTAAVAASLAVAQKNGGQVVKKNASSSTSTEIIGTAFAEPRARDAET